MPGRHATVWTAERLQALERHYGKMTLRQLAEALGVTRNAVKTKLRDQIRQRKGYAGLTPVQVYARRYHVPKTAVASVGIAALDAMTETERRSALWRVCNRKTKPDGSSRATKYVDRMMHLTDRIAFLKRWQERAA